MIYNPRKPHKVSSKSEDRATLITQAIIIIALFLALYI